MNGQTNRSARFPSLYSDPSRTRHSLRDRLSRFLSVEHSRAARAPSEVTLTDEDLLRLLTNLTIEHAGTIENARTHYEGAADPEGSFPGLSDLIAARWVRKVRNRVVISIEHLRASKSGLTPRDAAAYASLQQHQYDETYSFDSTMSDDPELGSTVSALKAGQLNLARIGSQRPEWVVSRLWEAFLSSSSGTRAALERWLDRWNEIGRPKVVPSEAWDDATAEAFRTAALQLLEEETSIGWGEVHGYFAQQMANAANVDVEVARRNLSPTPQTLIERYLWLTSRGCERPLHWGIWPLQDFAGLISILLADIEQTDLSPVPHPLFEKIMAIVEERPEFLFLLSLHFSHSPVLLADLLLRPSTAAWACLLIWRWQLRRDAWENNVLRRDDDRNKRAAFDDAGAVARYLLDEKNAPVAEVAGLLTTIYRDDRATSDTNTESSSAMRRQFMGELIQAKSEKIQEVIQTLFGSLHSEGPGSGTFAAALALVEESQLATVVDPAPLVTAYAEALTRGDHWLSAHQINNSQARVLLELAARAGSELRTRFLDPLEVPKRLSAISELGANSVMIADGVARTVRVHLRVLCRAIAGQTEQVPEDLVNALVSAIRTGSLARLERNQVDAFSAHYETDFPKRQIDRPISADLAAALSKLQGAQKEKLLNVVLEIEEPLTLARLLLFTPIEIHSKIRERVMKLTPSKASDLYMLNALQTRIDELLNAEFSDVAATFLEAEQHAPSLGGVPGRAISRLRHQLRLHLLRREWTSIMEFNVPTETPEQEQETAREAIEFYRALALLQSPDGDRTDTENRFARLQQKRPQLAAYTINLHATRVAKLLGNNIFGYIEEGAASDALRVIAEGERALLDFPGLTSDEAATIRLNNTLLFLGIKRPAKALDVLDEVETDRPRAALYAYRSVALERTQQSRQARAILATAEEQFGKTPLLEAARNQITSSMPFTGQVQIATDQDSVTWIRSALTELMRLDAGEQVRALSAKDGTIGDFLLGHVREAGAAVVGLVPIMRRLDMGSYEDDVTAVLKEILSARLRPVNWSVHDQSKGGVTHTGNPGERDLVIKKDTGILTVIEAVMTRLPTTNRFTLGDLTSHFQKLFAYETCPVYFHITYEMSGDRGGVLDHLKRASRENVPEGISFVQHEDIQFDDSRPTGFTATYKTAAGLRKTHFLLLELNLDLQRAAAQASDAANPRKSKKSTSKKPERS